MGDIESLITGIAGNNHSPEQSIKNDIVDWQALLICIYDTALRVSEAGML